MLISTEVVHPNLGKYRKLFHEIMVYKSGYLTKSKQAFNLIEN